MNPNEKQGQWFDSNLRSVAARLPVPPGPDLGLRERCLARLTASSRPSVYHRIRRPLFASSLGLAAMLAIAAFVVPFAGGHRTVSAEMILARLSEQLETHPIVDVTLAQLVVDEVSANGKLQISENGIGGDLSLVIQDDEGMIELDVALGLSEESKWVLIRRLLVPDPSVQALLMFLFPPGTETLLILPPDLEDEDVNLGMGEGYSKLVELFRSQEIFEAVQTVIQKHGAQGAIVRQRSDGLSELSMSLADQAILETLGQALDGIFGEPSDEPQLQKPAVSVEGSMSVSSKVERKTKSATESSRETSGAIGFSNGRLTMVYDPKAQTVQSIQITEIGAQRGAVSITLRDGTIDDSYLKIDRVITPATRRMDFTSLAKTFGFKAEFKFDGKP